MKTTHSIIGKPELLTAGKAIFTVSNGLGEYFTFKIEQGKPRNGGETPPYFASVLKGPDNTKNYAYIGLYRAQSGELQCRGKSKFKPGTKEHRVLVWAIHIIRNGSKLPDGYAIEHAGLCCRCGRTLTTPQSIEAGIGPVCADMGA